MDPARNRPMTISEKFFARRWIADAARGTIGVPWVEPGDTGFVRSDWRFSYEYVSPMPAIFFVEKLGKDARVTDAASILMFLDPLTYLHQDMPQARAPNGLLAGD